MINLIIDKYTKTTISKLIFTVLVSATLGLLPVNAISECVPGCVHQAAMGGGSFGGAAVAAVGDVNGDGVDDYAIGEHFQDDSRGRVYVFSGADCDDTLFIIYGQSNNDRFGIAITGMGDINDDGFADFMIGGDLYNSSSIYEGPGRAYLFYGRLQSEPIILNATDANWIIDGDPGLNGSFGRSMKGGADLNQDSVEDLVIGAGTASAYQGRLYIFLGNSSVTNTTLSVSDAFLTIIGTASDDAFGGIFDLGDFNGDGFTDITVSAGGSDAGGVNSGQAYVFLGPFISAGTRQATDAELLLTGAFVNQSFSVSVTFLNDINFDGKDELAIGAPTRHGTDIGNVYVYLGSSEVSGVVYPSDADITITGTDPDGYFGARLNGDGDVDGDGRGDLVISEAYFDDMATDVGRVYVMLGRDLALAAQLHMDQASCTFTGDVAYRMLGLSLSASVDFDDDGANEIIIGGPGRKQDIGMVYIYSYMTSEPCDLSYDVDGTISSVSNNLLGVPVDLYDSDNIVVTSAVTDESGEYQFTSLADGDYTVSISTPLGYQANEETKEVSIPCGPAIADFELTELEIIPQQRSRGYWKHQISHVIKNIEHGHNKPTDYSAEDFMGFLSLTESHFVLNQINPVTIYDGSTAGNMLDSLKLLKELLCAKKYNDDDISKKLRKGKAELMALILNVVSGKISQTEVISEDGANVSQDVTYSWMLLNDEITCTDEEDEADNDADEDACHCNYKKAEKILKKINHGKIVKANVIPLDIQFIAYKQGLTPNSYNLFQNYPNPFNPVTEISFSLPEAADVVLEIYNIRGQKVRTVVDDYFEAGNYTFTWDGTDFASGIYLYKLVAGDFVETRKMVLLK